LWLLLGILGFALLEGVARTPVFDKSVGMIRAGSPVAARADELLFGDEQLAIAAFELFVFNLVIASLSE
jgi:hypothetical protein